MHIKEREGEPGDKAISYHYRYFHGGWYTQNSAVTEYMYIHTSNQTCMVPLSVISAERKDLYDEVEVRLVTNINPAE